METGTRASSRGAAVVHDGVVFARPATGSGYCTSCGLCTRHCECEDDDYGDYVRAPELGIGAVLSTVAASK